MGHGRRPEVLGGMRMDYRLDPPELTECPRCGEFLIDDRCPDGCVLPEFDEDAAYERARERDWDYILEDSRS